MASLAVLCSAHGFGHLTRQLALGASLRQRGAALTFFTAAPRIVAETLPGVAVRERALDVGISQRDSLTEDVPATLALLEERCGDARLDALAAELAGFDLAIVDIAPPALEAARRAGVPALAVGNFDWAWIYARYPALSGWAARFGAWQAPHPALQLAPGPGLRGFAAVERLPGVLGRRCPPHPLPPSAVLVSFGGLGLADLDRALPRIRGITWVLAPPSPPLARPDCLYVAGVPYPALVAGAAAALTKPGYGIYAEAALAGTPLIHLDRGPFPEAAYLRAALDARGDRYLPLAPGAPGYAAALTAALCPLPPRPPPVAESAADAAADRVLAYLPQRLTRSW